MRLSLSAATLAVALALVSAGCVDRRSGDDVTASEPATTMPADTQVNRSPDENAAVTARDADGDRTLAPPAGSIQQRPRDHSDTPDEPQPPAR